MQPFLNHYNQFFRDPSCTMLRSAMEERNTPNCKFLRCWFSWIDFPHSGTLKSLVKKKKKKPVSFDLMTPSSEAPPGCLTWLCKTRPSSWWWLQSISDESLVLLGPQQELQELTYVCLNTHSAQDVTLLDDSTKARISAWMCCSMTFSSSCSGRRQSSMSLRGEASGRGSPWRTEGCSKTLTDLIHLSGLYKNYLGCQG